MNAGSKDDQIDTNRRNEDTGQEYEINRGENQDEVPDERTSLTSALSVNWINEILEESKDKEKTDKDDETPSKL